MGKEMNDTGNDYALFLLKKEQQIIYRDMQMQGPGLGALRDIRAVYLKSLGDAIDIIEQGKKQ